MVTMESWLAAAVRGLSGASAARVREEIRAHVEASMVEGGVTEEGAVRGLGDARSANRQYREVLLTAGEARLLAESVREGRFVCSRPWMPMAMAAIPVALLGAAWWTFAAGDARMARMLGMGGVVMGLLLAAPWFPIYTPGRSRVFRCVKWAGMVLGLAVAFGPEARNLSWLLFACAWPVVWIEWTRMNIRRKLRVEEWPKALYL